MKSIKDATNSLLSVAAPSVRQFLKLKLHWKDIMGSVSSSVNLANLSEPLGVWGDEVHIGVHRPAAVSLIKRNERKILANMKEYGFSVKKIVVKNLLMGSNPSHVAKKERQSRQDDNFSEDDIQRAMALFPMVEDEETRRKLAITWLKRGGHSSE